MFANSPRNWTDSLLPVQGKNFRLSLSCKNVLIGLTLTCDVSREKYRTCKGRRAAEPTEDLDARKMEAFQLNTKKRKKHKM